MEVKERKYKQSVKSNMAKLLKQTNTQALIKYSNSRLKKNLEIKKKEEKRSRCTS